MKNIFNVLRRWYRFMVAFIQKHSPGSTALKGGAYGMLLVSALMLVFYIIQFLPFIGILPVLAIVTTLGMAAILTGLLGRILASMVSRVPPLLIFSTVATVFVFGFQFGMSKNTGIPVVFYFLFFGSLAGGAIWFIYRTGWRKLNDLHKVEASVFGSVGVLGLLAAAVWLILPGQELEMPEIAALKSYYLPDHIEMVDPSTTGIYPVLKLTYGSGTDKRRKAYCEEAAIITDSVDGSFFVDGWKGISGKLRTSYFGFDVESLPRNGMVWYPDGVGPFPLVLIVHGNHLAQDFSEPGYGYLGELLASRGFIFVSVDENFLNGSFTNFFKSLETENDARGWLLLEHLNLWKEWNADTENVFYGKVDMHNISLIGHSRGGEAVAHAALFNRLPFYPDNAKVSFDYNFTIRSIVAIAPVDGQYMPSGIRTSLNDISYFVMQGSHDADVQSFLGMKQYERVKFSDEYQGFKAGLYIYNANHGQFNTQWGRKDYGRPIINLINLKQLMPEDDQRKIAEVYISAFLEATLSGKEEYIELFKDYRTCREWLPETVYYNRFDQTGMQYVCRYSEDLDITTTTLPGGFIETENLSVWREQMVKLKWGDKETRAAFIGWNNKDNDSLIACYSVSFPEGSILINDKSALFFSLADANEKSISDDKNEDENQGKNNDSDDEKNRDQEIKNNNKEDVIVSGSDNSENGFDGKDFSIELIDSSGESIMFYLNDHAFLQPQLEVKMHKLAFMKTAPGSEHLYHFFYFPIDRFVVKNEKFNFEKLVKISLIFDKTEDGVIILDNLGFM